MVRDGPGSVTSPVMEPEIWSRLPDELLERVLAFLPLKTFLNLRTTCKHFNSLIFSPLFISRHSCCPSPGFRPKIPPPFSSFLLLSHSHLHPQLPLYDSFLGRWRNLALPLDSLFNAPAHLLSSSNGLLCFNLPSSSSFLVSNLLAKSSRLIRFPTYPFSFESLTIFSTAPKQYNIFLLSSGSSSISAFVYDSRVRSWRGFEGFIPVLTAHSHQKGVFYNGYLYFTTPEPFSVVGFELETGKWKKLIAELPGELTFVRVVSSDAGKLYMVGGTGINGISRSMILWELEGGNENWVEVERVPEMMCRKFMSVCYHNYEHVYCFWHEGTVCVCCYTWPEILYYKVSRRTWHWLPRCPSLTEKWSCGFRWFSFVPDLYASI